MKRWSEEEDNILRSLYGNTKPKLIYQKLPERSIYSIRKRASVLKLQGNMRLSKKKYTIDLHYFKEVNLDNCYWAGFIAADGCVSKKDASVRIHLSKKDESHLRVFSNCIDYNGKISYTNKKNKQGKLFHYANLDLYGVKEWCVDLANNFNIINRKTLILEPPTNLTRLEQLVFIVGYIDGDGSIFINNKDRLCLALVGTEKMMLWMKNILNEEFKNNVNIFKYKKVYRLVYSGKTAINICKILSLNHCPFKLERKWNKLQLIN